MAPTLNLPAGFYQATFRYGGAALPLGAAVVFGGKNPATGSPTPASIGTALKQAWTLAGAVYESSGGWNAQTSMIDILVKMGPLVDGPASVTPWNLPLGANAGDPVSPNSALLVQKLTALGGHVGRGRMFLPGLGENDVSAGGTVSSTAVTNFQTKFNTTLGLMTSGDVPMYLLHTYDPDKGQTPRAPTLVTSLVLSSRLATQRHRLRR